MKHSICKLNTCTVYHNKQNLKVEFKGVVCLHVCLIFMNMVRRPLYNPNYKNISLTEVGVIMTRFSVKIAVS